MIEIADIFQVLNDKKALQRIKSDMDSGEICVVRRFWEPEKITKIVSYLSQVGSSSLPNYQSIHEQAPNFHRMNRKDERSYVKGCFHQFAFYPWNQDVFDLFHLVKPIYHLKNELSDVSRDAFLGQHAEHGCIARLSFQFYPKGSGYLNKHQDPVNYHQKVVPIMLLSKKGRDFNQGGAYVERPSGEKIVLDDCGDPGDIFFFKADLCHGVDYIDPESNEDWLAWQGRWMMLVAVNKVEGNQQIQDSRDLQ